MVEVLLDTNFLISCVKQKIHFVDAIKELLSDSEIVVPAQVVSELQRISTDHDRKYRLEDREHASLALQLIVKYRVIKGKGKYADKAIIGYVHEKNYRSEQVIVATIDSGLVSKVRNVSRVIKIRGLKRLVIE
ncbi:MAG: PIN domain-containing protein [Nanoarchaeota archaeon]